MIEVTFLVLKPGIVLTEYKQMGFRSFFFARMDRVYTVGFAEPNIDNPSGLDLNTNKQDLKKQQRNMTLVTNRETLATQIILGSIKSTDSNFIPRVKP